MIYACYRRYGRLSVAEIRILAHTVKEAGSVPVLA